MSTPNDFLDLIEAHTQRWARSSRFLLVLVLATNAVAVAINVLAIYRGGGWWHYAAVLVLGFALASTVRSHVRGAAHRDETLLWVTRWRMRRGPDE